MSLSVLFKRKLQFLGIEKADRSQLTGLENMPTELEPLLEDLWRQIKTCETIPSKARVEPKELGFESTEPYDPRVLEALILLHRFSILRRPNDIHNAALLLSGSVSLAEQPNFAYFFSLCATHAMQLFEETTNLVYLDRAIDLLDPIVSIKESGLHEKLLAGVGLSCACLQYSFAADEKQALKSALDFMRDCRRDPLSSQWTSSFGDIKSFIIIANAASRRYSLSYPPEDLSPSILAIKNVLDAVPSTMDHQYTALQLLILSMIFVLSETTDLHCWLGSLDALREVLRFGPAVASDPATLYRTLDQCALHASSLPLCIVHMADALERELSESSSKWETRDCDGGVDDVPQSLWEEEWEAARSYMRRRIQGDTTIECHFRPFRILAQVAQRETASTVWFRSSDPVGTHECIFEMVVTSVGGSIVDDSPELSHSSFYNKMRQVVKRLSPSEIDDLAYHRNDIDSNFARFSSIWDWYSIPSRWRKSLGVPAYLIWQKRQRSQTDLVQAGRYMLEVGLEQEPAFEHLLYAISGELKKFEKDSKAVGMAFRLGLEFLRIQSRGSPRHLLGVVDLGSRVVVEYFNHSTTPVASFEFALELFREAMELSKIQSWLLECRKVVILGRILHYRFKEVSEEDPSLDFTIQQFADIWKLLPVGRPFRASSTEVVVTMALLSMSRHLPTARWKDSLKLLTWVLEQYIYGFTDTLPDVENISVASQDLIDGGLNVIPFTPISEAMCLMHIADIVRLTISDCHNRPGILAVSLDMYCRNLRHPSHHYTPSRTEEDLSWSLACSEERNGLVQAILSAVQWSLSGIRPIFEPPSIMIFQYRATRPTKGVASFSHSCFLHYYITWVSQLSMANDSDTSSEESSSPSDVVDSSQPPSWPTNLSSTPGGDQAIAKVTHLRSTLMPGIENVLQNEGHDFFSLPLQSKTIRAYIRSLASEVRELESDLSTLSTKLIQQHSDDIYWDARDVQLNKRINKLKTNTPHIASLGPLQALVSRGPERCLELVEASRSLFWSRLLRLRVSFHGLPDPIARELEGVAQRLDKCKAQSTVLVSKEETQEQFDLEWKFNRLLLDVRRIPGFENFLKPKAYDELLAAASEGPVIVLVGTDPTYAAVTLQTSGVDAVFLPGLRSRILDQLIVGLNRATGGARLAIQHGVEFANGIEDETERAIKTKTAEPQTYGALLKEIWNLIVKPIFDSLGFTSVNPKDHVRNRIWWCPTGKFAFLPIHAAGSGFGSPTAECVSTYAISSYTPTITALIEGRSSYNSSPLYLKDLKTLVVAQPTTRNHSDLPMTKKELEIMEGIIPEQLLLRIGQGVPLSQSNTNCTVEATMHCFQEAAILHLACHGHQDRADPLDSGFELDDGRLSISRLMGSRTSNAWFAFLSACESASNDLHIPDECLNLAAAMLYAGFRSVIGTMWSMNDNDGPEVTRAVYQELFKHISPDQPLEPRVIPLALDSAVRKLQQSGVHPGRWATYIHLGV